MKEFKSRHITMLIFLAAGIVLLLMGDTVPIKFIGCGLIACGVLSAIK